MDGFLRKVSAKLPGAAGVQQAPAQEAVPGDSGGGAGVRSINLKTASKEEMAEFIKQFKAHTKQVEQRSRELFDSCRQLTADKRELVEEIGRLQSLDLPRLSASVRQVRAAQEECRRAAEELRGVARSGLPVTLSPEQCLTTGAVPLEVEVFRLREELAALKRSRASLQEEVSRTSAELGVAIEQQARMEAEKRELAEQLQQRVSSSPTVAPSVPAVAEDDEEKRKLQEKVAKLQGLLAKAKEQFDVKAKLAAEKSAESARTRGELSAAQTLVEDLREKLKVEEDACQRAQEAVRALRREQLMKQEALESRLRSTEAELSSVQEEFQAYKVRAQMAIKEQQEQRQQEQEQEAAQKQSATLRPEVAAQNAFECEAMRVQLELERADLKEKEASVQVLAKELAEARAALQSRTDRIEEIDLDRQKIEMQHKRAVSELEAEYSLKYEELKGALKDLRERSKKSLEDKEAQLAVLQAQLSEERQQLVQERSKAAPQPKSLFESAGPEQSAALLHVANLTAAKDAELSELRKTVAEQQAEIEDLESTCRLRELQEKSLKEQIRALDEGSQQQHRLTGAAATVLRDGSPAFPASPVDEYLKNVVVRYMSQPDDHDRLLPVLARLINLTQQQVSSIIEARQTRTASKWGALFGTRLVPPSSPTKP